MTRDVGLAEDLAQDALVAALEQWPAAGVPENPIGWLMTTAKRRTIPWTSVVGEDGPSLDPALFQAAGEQAPGAWRAAPAAWPSEVGVEGSLLAGEVRDELRQQIDLLPDRQRVVITLRDVLGYTSEEVAELLELSAVNQRVLLHRARTAVRAGLASYLQVGAEMAILQARR